MRATICDICMAAETPTLRAAGWRTKLSGGPGIIMHVHTCAEHRSAPRGMKREEVEAALLAAEANYNGLHNVELARGTMSPRRRRRGAAGETTP